MDEPNVIEAARMDKTKTTKFPNFLVIGAAKSGTYTLYEHFASHPEVFMCPIKEPHFFAFGGEDREAKTVPAHSWVESLDEYLQLFAAAGDARMAGECSVSYLYWPGTAERIHQFDPNMRLIVSLREPVGRAYSSFNYAKSYGIEPLKTLSEGFKAEHERIQKNQSILLRYRDVGLYSAQLQRFYDVFPKDQIKVILFDQLLDNPSGTVRELYKFIGVAPDVDLNPDVRANVTKCPDDSNPLHRFINGDNLARAALRKILPMPAREKLRNIARDALFKKPPQLDPEERRRFLSLFQEDIKRLEKLIGHDLSAWLE
jgi:hypothetical protein